MSFSTPTFGVPSKRTLASSPVSCDAPFSQFKTNSFSQQSPQSERPAKRTRYDFGEDITVLVGKKEKRYAVHKKLACANSSFFRTACEEQGPDGKEVIVKLPGAYEFTMNVYLCWIYTGEIDVVSKPDDTELPVDKYRDATKNLSHIFLRLASVFEFAREIGDILLKNTIIDELVLFLISTGFELESVDVMALWKVVPQGSSFLKAVVDYVALQTPEACFSVEAKEYPAGFVGAMAKASFRDRKVEFARRGPLKRARCFYHEHFFGNKGRTKECSES